MYYVGFNSRMLFRKLYHPILMLLGYFLMYDSIQISRFELLHSLIRNDRCFYMFISYMMRSELLPTTPAHMSILVSFCTIDTTHVIE